MPSSQTDASDEALMARFQTGERAALSLLVKRYQGTLYNFALRHLRVHAIAQDVVQDAFVRVVHNASDFKHQARFSTWVFTIVRNLCIDQLRKQSLRRHRSLDEPKGRQGAAECDGPTLGEQTADGKANVDGAAVSAEIRVRVLSALDQMPDEQREVFLLREVSNLPFRDIAEIVGISENTVKSRMRYALERLREALGDYEEYARALR